MRQRVSSTRCERLTAMLRAKHYTVPVVTDRRDRVIAKLEREIGTLRRALSLSKVRAKQRQKNDVGRMLRALTDARYMNKRYRTRLRELGERWRGGQRLAALLIGCSISLLSCTTPTQPSQTEIRWHAAPGCTPRLPLPPKPHGATNQVLVGEVHRSTYVRPHDLLHVVFIRIGLGVYAICTWDTSDN